MNEKGNDPAGVGSFRKVGNVSLNLSMANIGEMGSDDGGVAHRLLGFEHDVGADHCVRGSFDKCEISFICSGTRIGIA